MNVRVATYRSILAAQKRAAREAARRLRELEKLEREVEKQSEQESARLAVESHETQLAMLQSMHRECMEPVDWERLAAQLPAPLPGKSFKGELLAFSKIAAGKLDGAEAEHALLVARAQDATECADRRKEWDAEEELRGEYARLARDVLRGDVAAFQRALTKLDPFSEIIASGTPVSAVVRDPKRVECRVAARGIQVIPDVTKTLTASGKLSVKPAPRARLQEIFQDYLCSCVLRVAREVFSCLPVDEVTVHASTVLFDPSIGRDETRTVLSVRFDRSRFVRLNFDRIDPSDAVDGFESRCDFKASRKSGAFVSVEPLPPRSASEDAGRTSLSLRDVLARARGMRAQLGPAPSASAQFIPS